ncbi:acyl-CoA N-acyltransferase [Cokeromyces recurvatus]|uniref:acyl-CoA N-acyltransferase n=1 Tax=Cokeromyces recurvatus TaxID=90255 RepID=UPI00221E97C5|nr:acyl-CoA N-acyltransferase [Cokeromyces recurvatus]KAI7902751.1 acyl-CoA N-acyltransferase [Cokeromyces recurvatus]
MVKYFNTTITKLKVPDEISRAHAVRYQVFVLEQGYTVEIDRDNNDEKCHLWIATCDKENDDGTVEHNVDVGTVRLWPKEGGVAKLGRIAVLSSARGLSIGRKLCETFIEYCKNNGFHTIVLNSQIGRRGFYEKIGFRVEEGDDDIFDDSGTPHVRMWMRNL